MRKPALRLPVLHQKLVAYVLEKNTSSPTSRRFNIEIRSYRDSCKNLRQENARINALVNQIHIAKGSMHTKNNELTQQLQTSNIEIGRLQAEASDLRNSVGRSQSTENLEQLLHWLPHRWKRIAVSLRSFSRRERSFFITIRFFPCNSREKPCARKKMNKE